VSVEKHHQTTRITIRQWSEQHPVHDRKHGRRRADAQRERDHDHRAEGWMTRAHPKGVPHVTQDIVEPGAVATGPHAFFRLLDAAEIEDGHSASFSGRHSVAHFVGNRHLDKRTHLLVEVLFGLVATDNPAPYRREAMQERHAPSRTLVTANETRFHRSRCRSSWRRPAAVSR
jgi:hypothetical protein